MERICRTSLKSRLSGAIGAVRKKPEAAAERAFRTEKMKQR